MTLFTQTALLLHSFLTRISHKVVSEDLVDTQHQLHHMRFKMTSTRLVIQLVDGTITIIRGCQIIVALAEKTILLLLFFVLRSWGGEE